MQCINKLDFILFDPEEIALAACEIAHDLQSSVAYLRGTHGHGVAPNYLNSLLQSYMPSRSLISQSANLDRACRKHAVNWDAIVSLVLPPSCGTNYL